MNAIYFYHTSKGWVWEQDGYKSPAYASYEEVLTDYHDYKPLPSIFGNSEEFVASVLDTVSDLKSAIEETFPVDTTANSL